MAKGAGLKILSRRCPRVQIPSLAYICFRSGADENEVEEEELVSSCELQGLCPK